MQLLGMIKPTKVCFFRSIPFIITFVPVFILFQRKNSAAPSMPTFFSEFIKKKLIFPTKQNCGKQQLLFDHLLVVLPLTRATLYRGENYSAGPNYAQHVFPTSHV